MAGGRTLFAVMLIVFLIPAASASLLAYDDGSAEDGYLMYGGPTPSEYVAVWFNTTAEERVVNTIHFYIYSQPAPFWWWVYNGSSSTFYDGEYVAGSGHPTSTGWHNISVDVNVGSDFWVFFTTNVSSWTGYPSIGYDDTAPLGNHSRYLFGSTLQNWTSDDIMIRATVSSATVTTTTSTTTTTTSSTTTTTTTPVTTSTIPARLELDLVSPNASTSLTNGSSMNFTVTVRCASGTCGNVTVTLDPFEAGSASLAEGFRTAYGENWNIVASGDRVRLLGGGITPAGKTPASNDSEVDSITRQFLIENSELLGLNESNLATARIDTDAVAEDDTATYLYYRQEHEGVAVYGGYALVAYRNDNIVSVKSNFLPGVDVNTTPSINADDATEIAKKLTQIPQSLKPAKAELVVYPVESGAGRGYILAWKIMFPYVSELEGAWTYIVDARESRVVRYWDDAVSQVSGTVTGKIYSESSYRDEQTTVNFTNNLVYIKQGATTIGNATTNENGSYTVPAVSGSVNVYAQLVGPYVRVLNEDSGESSHNQAVTAPTNHSWEWSGDDASANDAESNIFYHVNRVFDWYTRGSPFNITQMNYQMNATVEVGDDSCNAYYSPADEGLHFGSGDGTDCYNLALYSDVIYHEYTHGVVDHVYTTNLPYIDETGAMNEAWADYFACTINNNSAVGEGVMGGTTLRYANNSRRFLNDWINEVHEDAIPLLGALWDMRESLGAQAADSLVIRTMKLMPMSFTEELEDILVSDDDNANLADGTPNINAICQAFYDGHGISSAHCLNHTSNALYNISLIRFFGEPGGWYTSTGVTYATKFTPSAYPANISKFAGAFKIQDVNNLNFRVHVYADDGGQPGANLTAPVTGSIIGYKYVLNVLYVGVVNLSAQIDSGSFWLGVELYDNNGPYLAVSSTTDSTSMANGGAGWQDLTTSDPVIKAGVESYLGPPMPTTTTTTTIPGATTTSTTTTAPATTTTSTTTTTTISTEKGDVPMNSGSPFYTPSQNPRYPQNLSCLVNMTNTSSCNVSWVLTASGPYQPYTFFATANSSSTSNTSESINITITEPPRIRINEFAANPAAGPEWIEVYNLGTINVSLTGWTISTSGGNQTMSSPTVYAGGFAVIYSNETNFTLNDTADTITLIYLNGSTQDNISYNASQLNASWSSIPSNVSVGRSPDGVGNLSVMNSPTPGTSNAQAQEIALASGWNLVSISLIL